MRLLLGTDVFVSYAHRDERYARSLARGLQDAGFTCVLDQHVGVPGQRLPGEVLTELKRASALIVVASEAACYSRAVQQEVRIFAPTGRPLLVLSFVPRLAQTPLGALLPGLVPHAEPEAALAGPASKGALERAIDQLDFTRQTRRIRRSVSAAAATLAVLLVAIGGALLGLGRARGELDGIEERLGNARLVLAAQSATDPLRQSLLLAEADPTLPPPGGRQLAADLAWQDVPFAVLDVEGVQAAHLSDDGTRILTVAADLRLFDAETYAELWRSTPELGTPQEAALLAQGARVLVRTVDELVLLDPAGGQPAWRCRQEPWSEGGAWNAIYRLAPGGERLLVWGERLRGLTSIAVSPSGTLELSRWDTGAEIVDATFLEYSAEVVALIHEPNQAGGLRVWTPDGKRAGLPGPSWDSRLSPGGHFAISSDDRGDLLVPTEATSSGSPRHTGSPTRARVFTDHLVEEVSLDGDVALLKGTQSGSWELCDLTGDAEPVPLPQAPWSEGEGVHFVDEDRRVLGIFDGLAVRVWNVDPESPDAPESAYSQAPIVDARWVDRKLVLGDKEGTVRIRSASDNP
ncbi:MAG: toll/interleukin-1 receptor domain-containing protein, partial [Planctomycetota bacterium]